MDESKIVRIDLDIRVFSGVAANVVIRTPLSIRLSADEAAELVRDAWEKAIVPVQGGFCEPTSLLSLLNAKGPEAR